MVEFLLDILTLVMGPQAWRKMSGPAIVAGALLWGAIGLGVALAGAAAIVHVGPTVDPWLAWGEFGIGLLVLGDVVFGVAMFVCAKPERS